MIKSEDQIDRQNRDRRSYREEYDLVLLEGPVHGAILLRQREPGDCWSSGNYLLSLIPQLGEKESVGLWPQRLTMLEVWETESRE